MIDVIISPAVGADAARRCGDAVRSVRCAEPAEILVMDPAEALRLHPDRDVVLLGTAVEVPDGWLDRLAAAARREPGVATVSPFANRGAFASYPCFAADNALPAGVTPAALDAIFARENAGVVIDLPAPEAACMYVTRAAIEAVGADGMGGDFAVRARSAGLRHVLCADLFVVDRGDAANVLPAGLDAAAREFAEREPARPARRRVDVARLAASPRPRLLMVAHHWGGGVERHVRDLARLAAGTCEVLLLRPDGAGVVELAWLAEGEEFRAWFDAAQWEAGVALLEAIGIDRMHFHHVHELPREALDLPARLGVAYDVTLHDYYPICPRYHLSPADGESCAGESACERCLDDGRPAQWGLGLADWRTLFHGFLRQAARVIVPSHDVARRVRGYFDDVTLLEWAHPEWPEAAPAVFKVALLGAVSAIKGARLLEACVADAAARRLPLHFHVIGHVDRPMRTLPEAPLTIGGSYAEGELATRIALERPDAFLFLSQVAETWSYTLTTAMQTGLPIVATRVGAFPERLGTYPSHALAPSDATPASVNDALLERLRTMNVRPLRPAAAIAKP